MVIVMIVISGNKPTKRSTGHDFKGKTTNQQNCPVIYLKYLYFIMISKAQYLCFIMTNSNMDYTVQQVLR